MSEQRNPYAASEVPLEAPVEPVVGLGADVEYGGFWRRVGALFLDGLIVLPITLLTFFGLGYSRLYYFYYVVPGILFNAFFYMYLVKRYGGTPGKRILDMRIVMADGSPVTQRAAILRNVVEWGAGGVSMIALALAGLSLTDAQFEPLGYVERLQLVTANAPKWNSIATYTLWAWLIAGAIAMLSNDKRRGVHDFFAGTVVVRTR